MKPTAFIFDLDGTLLDTLRDIAVAMNHALQRCGFPPRSDEFYKFNVGGGALQLAELASGASHEPARDVLAQFRAYYDRNLFAYTQPYPGAVTALRSLARMNVPFSVLSNKPHAMTVALCAHFFPDLPIGRAWGDRPEFPKKPNPAAALALAQLMERAPGDVGFVGDTEIDMETALKAQMVPLGAGWGFRPTSLTVIQPLETFQDFDQFSAWLPADKVVTTP